MSDFSKRTLRALREEAKLDYTHSSHGIMHFYTDKEDYESSKAGAKLMTSLGCPRNTITPDEVIQIEPALSPVHDKLIGGDFTPTTNMVIPVNLRSPSLKKRLKKGSSSVSIRRLRA